MSLAIARPLHEAFNFHVSIGTDEAKFSRCAPLRMTINFNTYREAGSIVPIKDPNEVDFENITLSRGVSNSRAFYDWANSVAAVTVGLRNGMMIIPQRYSKNLTIYQKDRTKKTIQKYFIYEAVPVDFVAGEWDSTRDEVVMESLTLSYKYFVCSTP